MRIRNSMGPAGFVISVFALVLALSGGAAVAASKITAKQIKNGAVTQAKIKNNAVTGAKVKDGTLTINDFTPGDRARILGPKGVSTTVVESPALTVAAYDSGTVYAYCPVGKQATGGGYFSSIAIAAASIPGKNSWAVIINNYDNSIAVEVNAWVVCA